MRSCPFAVIVLAAATLAFPIRGAAQEERIWRPAGGGSIDAEVVLYREPGYDGPSIRIQTPVPDLGLDWNIRSIRVVSGEWQLCARRNYEACVVVRNDIPSSSSLGSLGRIRSARPLNVDGPSVEGESGPRLRGMAAEFFTHPAANGRRVLACRRGSASLDCARDTAERFCRTRGYSYVGNVAMQSVSGRVYLADVLCKRSAS